MDPRAYEVVHELEESHWFFVARRRILACLLDDLLEGQDHPAILDVGCGTGATVSLLEHYGTVTGIDISAQAIQYCKEQGRARLCQADGSCLPFASESFDLVTALDLLDHLEDESGGLGEMRRVLKNRGRMLLCVPAFMFLWSDFDRFSGHRRRYSKEELKCKVEQAGFEVTKLSHFNTILFPVVWAVRVVKNFLGKWKSLSSDLEMPAKSLNTVLTDVFALESGLMAHGDLPFGVSLLCIARKRRPEDGSDED
jgi:SAM-dependent methyltransferase